MPEQKESVTIRLPPAVKRRIEEASEASGLDRSEFMRNLIAEALSREAFERRVVATVEGIDSRIETSTAELARRMDKLRENLANAMLAILVELNKGLPEEKRSSVDALKSWVKKTLAN